MPAAKNKLRQCCIDNWQLAMQQVSPLHNTDIVQIKDKLLSEWGQR